MATKRKPAPKKRVVKKSVSIVPAIKPQNTFRGWAVNRSKSNNNISFGCGKVRVRKEDLQLLGRNPEVINALKRVIAANNSTSSWNSLTLDELLNIKSKTFLRIAGN